MLKLCSVLILCILLSDSIVSTEIKPKNNATFKPTESTAATNAEVHPRESISIVMEGQPPSTEKVKTKPSKPNKEKTVKKGSSIVPKKGVSDQQSEKVDQSGSPHDSSLQKPQAEKSSTTVVNGSTKMQIAIKNYTQTSTFTENTKAINGTSVRKESATQKVVSSSTTTTKKPQRHKPLVTIGGDDADGPIPHPPTEKSPLITLSKIDYIVPVLITMTALPLLGIAFYALYKRGRDYWSKRHYRRMDFLIDGMYNE